MSQRLGMADGRCFTINSASRLVNDYVMTQYGIPYENNYMYRQLLQKKGPEIVERMQALQQSVPAGANSVNRCQGCDLALLKMPTIF